MTARRFELQVDDEIIVGDMLGQQHLLRALFLHGAGQSHRLRQRPLREELMRSGVGSIALDFSGHGESSANSAGSLEKRLRQAQCVSAHVDVIGAIRTVVGTSMSGEIALRLACQAASRIDHVVLIVGAIYNRAAFSLPFGPAFSAAIRRPQSWRRAETLELMRDYRGGLTLIRALEDTVIPHEVADLLEQAAVSARFRRVIDLPATDHRVSEKMANDIALRQRIAAAIKENIRENNEE
jgi:pimeloyl-ACP methyl ester carboxylesterase